MPSSSMNAADARTLALATPPLTAERLARWMRGQEALLATFEAARAAGRAHPAALAEGHRGALDASGLDAKELAQVEGQVRAFCAALGTVAAFSRRIAALEGQPADEARDAELGRLQRERAQLESLESLHRRYGEDSVASLAAREGALLALHARLARVLAG